MLHAVPKAKRLDQHDRLRIFIEKASTNNNTNHDIEPIGLKPKIHFHKTKTSSRYSMPKTFSNSSIINPTPTAPSAEGSFGRKKFNRRKRRMNSCDRLIVVHDQLRKKMSRWGFKIRSHKTLQDTCLAPTFQSIPVHISPP